MPIRSIPDAGARRSLPPPLAALKRAIVESIVRTKLDATGDLFNLTPVLRDFRWEDDLSPTRIRAIWKKHFADGTPRNHFLSCYLHFPYCRSKCNFCFTSSRVSPGPAAVERYVAETVAEARFLAPAFKGREFRFFSMGGGTPSLLSAAQLQKMLSGVFKSFQFEKGAGFQIEMNPVSTTRPKLRILHRLGFDRISFGIQSLESKVLRSINRGYQRWGDVRAAVLGARAEGFKHINVDLMLGLVGESMDGFLDGFRKSASLRPTSINVCGLTVTNRYMKVMKVEHASYLRHCEDVWPVAMKALARLSRETGYRPMEFDENSGLWMFVREGESIKIWESWSDNNEEGGPPSSMLGLGHDSRSQIFGRLHYLRLPKSYGEDEPLFRSVSASIRDEMSYFVLWALEHSSRVEHAAFHERFAADIRKEFELELKALKALGLIRFDSSGLQLLSETPSVRFFCGAMFLMDHLASFSNGGLNPALIRSLKKALAKVSLAE